MSDLLHKFHKFLDEHPGPTTQDRNSIVLLVDFMNLYLRAFAATPTMNDDGNHVGGITGFLLSLAAAIRHHHPTRVIVVCDGKGGSQRRRALYEGYKAHRKMTQKLNRTYDFQTLQEEQESRKWQIVLLIQMLKCLPVSIMNPDNVEADDVIAYCAQLVQERGGKALILSTDRDFFQLVNENVSVLGSNKNKLYTTDGILESYSIHPCNYLLYRTITGDKSDNIPGVEGIQQKTLVKHFPELREDTAYDIDYLLNRTNELLQASEKKKPPKVLQRLSESRERLELNMKLMRLDDVAMSGQTRLKVVEEFDAPSCKYDKYHLTKLARLYKLIDAFGRWDDWLYSSFMLLTRFQ